MVGNLVSHEIGLGLIETYSELKWEKESANSTRFPIGEQANFKVHWAYLLALPPNFIPLIGLSFLNWTLILLINSLGPQKHN